jgi:microcystin degradation protein MlrC
VASFVEKGIALKVFIAGFQHETNTFAPTKADWDAFTAGSGWLPYMRGAEVLQRYRGRGVPLSGFIDFAEERGWTLLPSVWAGANPSAHVTRAAFERIAGEIVEDLRAAIQFDGVDAVYLDLHGAAVTEHLDDPEGELLVRVRAVVGQDIPIVASLDLHANVSEAMLATADAMACYRTYPHIDHAATGTLAGELLQRRLAHGSRETLHARRLDFLLPLNAQCTLIPPAGRIYDTLLALDREHGTMSSFAMGFPAADVPMCGPLIWSHGTAAREVVERLHAMADQPRAQWQLELLPPRQAVAEAMRLARSATTGPVIIADTQDNPGAGADGNTTGLLHALLASGAGEVWPERVAFGLLADPLAAAAAHAAGTGASLAIALGRSVPDGMGGFSDPPVQVQAHVRALSDGRVRLTGPMALGGEVALGLSACLDVGGVLIGVTSQKVQVLDRELLRFLGMEPEHMRIIVLKSSVHFRADFGEIASHVLIGKARGPMAADPADLPWKNLPPGRSVRP